MQLPALTYEIAIMRKRRATIAEIRERLSKVCEPTKLSDREIRNVLRNSLRILPTV